MSGVTKYIFMHEVCDFMKLLGEMLRKIVNVLPQKYGETNIEHELLKYYPFEIEAIRERLNYYQTKEHYLQKRGKKSRYSIMSIHDLLNQTNKFKLIMNYNYQQNHANAFNIEKQKKAIISLESERKPKIQRIEEKIQKGKEKLQSVTPEFIDRMIGLYERKNTSQKDRVYILAELKKYYCSQIIQFFFKLVDTELNSQLRWEAFYYLQGVNFHPRARRQKYMHSHTRNKKRKDFLEKIYPSQQTIIEHTPEELEYRINNSKEQKIKSFDYFICHSSKDSKAVQSLITYENEQSKNVFCDWISDRDYLKRHLLCKATLEVINKRLEQSNALIFVSSENSTTSVWCCYELNYFYRLNKQIYQINISEIINGNYELSIWSPVTYLREDFEDFAIEFGENL